MMWWMFNALAALVCCGANAAAPPFVEDEEADWLLDPSEYIAKLAISDDGSSLTVRVFQCRLSLEKKKKKN